MKNPWVRRVDGTIPKHRIFCFPHAGGGASVFRNWQGMVPENVEIYPVLLPGREYRMSEALIDNIPELVALLYRELISGMDIPFSFYGHSMGALVAYELAKMLKHSGNVLPSHLFLAARGAAHLNGEYEYISHLSDSEFICRVSRFEGLPKEVTGNLELMEIITPVLRADFHCLDSYLYIESDPLDINITTLHGSNDFTVNEDWIRSWKNLFYGNYNHRVVPGNHFFLDTNKTKLVHLVMQELNIYLNEKELVLVG